MLSLVFENELKAAEYTGGLDVQGLMMALPSTVTVFLKDDGSFGCVTPAAGVGMISGYNTPEDALAANWLEMKSRKYMEVTQKQAAKIARAAKRKRRY